MFPIIIDGLLGIAILVAIIVGLARGFCRQFSRPLVGLFAIIGGAALTTLIYPLITSTGILNGFMQTAAGWFKPEFYRTTIDSVETLQATIADNYMRILSSSAESLYARMGAVLADTGLEMTIGNFLGVSFVNLICQFGMWVVFYIAIKYLLFGIRFLLKKITLVVVFKSIDKIFGLVWSLMWTYIIVVTITLTTGEIVLTRFLPDFAVKFADFVNQTTLLKLCHNSNVLGSYIAEMLGMSLVTLS